MADDGPVLLCEELHLYLRHVAKVTVAVVLPEMKGVSVSISNWEIMEKLKALAAPEVFSLLRVGKTTRQILYFEGELSSLRALRKAIVQLHGKSIKLSGLPQQLRLRAGETELHFPTKKDWEGYFRDRGVPSFDEGLPGDRCDTVSIQGIPTQWMVPPSSSSSMSCSSAAASSSSTLLPVVTSSSKTHDKVARHDFIAARLAESFGKFGAVRRVDIVENAGELAAGSFSSFGPSSAGGGTAAAAAAQSTFDGYVQYESYDSFCSAMAGLRGMKLARRVKGEPELAVAVAVAFDKASHMSDRSVRRRRKDLERQLELEQQATEMARTAAAAEKRRREERQQQEKKQRDEEERRRHEKAAAEALRQREERDRRRREQEQRRAEEKRQRRAEREAQRERRHAARRAEDERRHAELRAEDERRALEQQRRLEAEHLLAQVLLMAAAQRRLDAQREHEEEARQERARREETRRQEQAAEEAARQAEARLVLRQRDEIIKQIKSMEDRHLELQRCLLKRKLASERALLQAAQTAKK